MFRLKNALFVLMTALLLASCDGDDGATGATGPAGPAGPAGADGADGAAGADNESTTISLSLLSRVRNPDSEFDESAAEIVTFDPTSQNMFVVNAQSGNVDVFSLASPAAPSLSTSLNVAEDVATNVAAVASAGDLGAANSVAVESSSNTLAVAIEADTKQDNGYIVFYQASDGTFLSAVEVGALPDMVTFTPDGTKVVVANEGEPSGDYQNDPEGSVSIIDVSGGASTVTEANVTTATFTAFNGAAPEGVRVFGPNATVAQDMEPEYVAVSADSTMAWVALQENNAIAVVDLMAGTITDIHPLGFKNHRLLGNELDGADDDNTINIQNWPVFGMYQPDAIAAYQFNGTNYIVTANEGDAREYFDESITSAADCLAAGGYDFDDDDGCLVFIDEYDIEDLLATGATIDLPDADVGSFLFDANSDGVVNEADLAQDSTLGRYAVTITEGETSGCDIYDGAAFQNGTSTCVFEGLYGYGARSFSIFNADTGDLVFDSGSDFERITAERLGSNFNSDNDENGSGDSRSDAKGPEPEAVELATIGGKTYAFIGLERVGGIMVYDISVPEQSSFVQYINTRDFTIDDVEDPSVADDIDLGPEGVEFVSAEDSPNGNALLLVGHEVSGTITVLEVSTVTLSD